ncbi:MAG: MotA/TolQ/ExbB proton channel family protein [Gammaproteobacteria bacterium]
MKKSYPVEFFYQVVSLLASIIIVHTIYVTVIRPRAEAELAEQAAHMEVDPNYVVERSIPILIRDFEQESCFILFFWAITIMGYKGVLAVRERKLLEMDLLRVHEGIKILPDDTREYARNIQALPDNLRVALVPRSSLAALHRFNSTRNIQDASAAAEAVLSSESDRLDSELSMVRYIAWAIPSIGFIGTVRGIGDALGQAHQAVEGNIAGVTQSLGTAFNSTFVALLLSIVLMFLLHQLQLHQERLVLDTETYLDQQLLRHLEAR